MTAPATHSLDRIVDITVYVSPLAAPRPTFNQMLVLGPTSGIIDHAERLREYDSAADMLTDGYNNTDPEYLVAALYFAQSPAPDVLWVGWQDPSSLKTVTINAAGTGYAVGDLCTVVQGTASGGVVRVATIDVSGGVTSLEINGLDNGTGYTFGTGLTTTGGTGTGFLVNITDIGETPLVGLEQCRAANYQWYVCMATEAVAADHKEIALWVESATPTSVYAFTTADADCITNAETDVFTYLKDRDYSRTIGQYSTDSLYSIAAIMGYAMGQNTGLANSAYTLKFKQETGIAVEELTTTQIGYLEGKNGNVYLNYGNYYTIFEQGKMANGSFFDEVINLDMLVNDIQLNVMDLLYQNPKIPQTDAGVTQVMYTIADACEDAVTRGFLAPGKWLGLPVLNLNTNDVLPKGYLIQATAVADQSTADRQARISPPIYVAVKEAGALHSIVIGVYVDR